MLQIDGDPCRFLPLTKHLYAIVDADLYEVLKENKWYAVETERTYYAARYSGVGRPRIYLHRFVLKLRGIPDPPEVDHKNSNGLDNRYSNLRPCTRIQNCANSRSFRNLSGYKGVSKNGKGWASYLRSRVNGKLGAEYLGTFPTPEEAALAYDRASKLKFGDFAKLNFPEVNHGR